MARGNKGRNRNRQGGWSLRKDGRYDAYVTVDTSSGPKRYKTTKNTEDDADQWITTVKYEARQDGYLSFDVSKLTVAEFMRRWLDDSVRGDVRNITWKTYDSAFRTHIKPSIGQLQLTKLSPAHVNSWVRSLIAGGVGAGRVQNTLSLLKRALNSAVEWELAPKNVAATVKGPRYEVPEKTPIAFGDMPQFFKAVEGDALEALFLIAATSGLRISELLALRWEDVDFKAGQLVVDEGVVALPGGVREFNKPKTRRGTRRLPLSRRALISLRERHRAFREKRMETGERGAYGRDLIFESPRGGAYLSNSVLRRWHKILDRAGLPRIAVHDLRHTAATLLFRNRTDIKTVQGILGHASSHITMDTYTHYIPEVADDAMSGLDDLLDSDFN